jgi:hypothetical protein
MLVDMEKYRAEKAQPNPRSTINSYRSFGYNLSTAIADIIDNSISAGAKNIWIDGQWKGSDSTLTIMDDGKGMDLSDLISAMTPGSKDPEAARDEKDLGRFGMGLKTSSFSQCKRLTVITKCKGGNVIFRCWDIDYINEIEEWTLLEYVSDSEFLRKIDELESGTLIIWEKLDRIVGNAKDTNEAVKSAFYAEQINVMQHLGLVFHKFIEQSRIAVIFNGKKIQPWNPFLLNFEKKPEMGLPETLVGGINVTYFILPHMSEISKENYENSGGPLGWFHQQGFYIYRADRLLVAGDWLELEKKREYSKLARIEINFPNSNDFNWNLDIKKSTAKPPIEIRKDLGRIAKVAIMKSAKTYNWRGTKTYSNKVSSNDKREFLWLDETTRDGFKQYKLNKKHPVILQFLSAPTSSMANRVFKLIEDNVPIELFIDNQNENPGFHESKKTSEIPSDELISLAVEIYNIQVNQGVPDQLAKSQIMQSAPFFNYPLISDYLS